MSVSFTGKGSSLVLHPAFYLPLPHEKVFILYDESAQKTVISLPAPMPVRTPTVNELISSLASKNKLPAASRGYEYTQIEMNAVQPEGGDVVMPMNGEEHLVSGHLPAGIDEGCAARIRRSKRWSVDREQRCSRRRH